MHHSHQGLSSEIKVENLLKYRERLFRFVQNRVNDFDQAEDIFQDSLLKALQKAPEFSAEEKLLSWFYTILRNSIIDSYRKQGTNDKKIDSLVQSFPQETNTEIEKDLCQCFTDLLPEMNSDYREIIEKLELGSENPAQLAVSLNISKENLKVKRFRARQQLKKYLQDSCRACATHGCLDCTCK